MSTEKTGIQVCSMAELKTTNTKKLSQNASLVLIPEASVTTSG